MPSDEHYAAYYPPRELAVHVPAYLSLLFVLAPVVYMGLNMLWCRGADGIDGVWDTRSDCAARNDHRESVEDDDDVGGGDEDRYLSSDSLPEIRDEDVASVNSRVSRRLLAGSAQDRYRRRETGGYESMNVGVRVESIPPMSQTM